MKTLPFTKLRPYIIIISLIIFSGGIGYRLGQKNFQIDLTPSNKVVLHGDQPTTVSGDFSLFWDVWQRLFRYYIDPKALEAKTMVYGAITGMVNSLGDPYTIFLPPKENKEFKQDLGGEFEGIGAQLGVKDSHIVVIAPLKKTPAERAGIKAGDWIIKVNDEDTTGWTIPTAVSKIRGPKGTSVKLIVLHENGQKPIEITVMRDSITVSSVDTWVKNISDIKEISGLPKTKKIVGKVGYLRLSRFGDHSNDEWIQAVNDMLRQGRVNGLVFDLRNNPGGYLEGAVYIASEFIKNGIVVSQVNSDGTKQDYKVNRSGHLLDIPLIVLVNKGSASAAEIVAGALQDYKRGKLVGEVTFGKGSVQTPQELAGGAGLHITTGKWLLPSGQTISKKGVTPDFIISGDDSDATRDAQLAKAVELLLK